jgi:hypothetical protein
VTPTWSNVASDNTLAHKRLAEIDYVQLWDDFADVRTTLPAGLASLR